MDQGMKSGRDGRFFGVEYVFFNQFDSPQMAWCPLFGVLPYNESSGVTDFAISECINIVITARHLWGSQDRNEHYELLSYGFEWGPFLDHIRTTVCPTSEEVSFYPETKLLKAREFYRYWLDRIYPAIRKKAAGGYSNEDGYRTGCPTHNLPTEDVLYCVHSTTSIQEIRPAEALSLLAICIAWQVTKLILIAGKASDTPGIPQLVFSAKTFIDRAIIEDLYDESERLKPHAERGKKVLEAARKGQEERQNTKQKRWDSWQRAADYLWRKFPSYSKHRVAGMVVEYYNEHGESVTLQTIEKKIKKPL